MVSGLTIKPRPHLLDMKIEILVLIIKVSTIMGYDKNIRIQ